MTSVFRAKLDAAGVYQGVEEVAELVAGDIPVPADCDLPPGKYKWLGDTFMSVDIIDAQAKLKALIELANGGAK